MEYTRGPWNIWDKERELNPELATGMPLIVSPPSSTGFEETEDIATINADNDNYIANANLISAAPELLEACKEGYEALKDIINAANNDHPYNKDELLKEFNNICNNIYNAIAKAEGR